MEIFFGLVAFGVAGIFASYGVAGAEGALWFVALLIVGFIVLCFWLSFSAKRQIEIIVDSPPQEAAEVVRGAFGLGWRSVSGRGAMNFQAKGIGFNSYGMSNPVISIDIESTGNGSAVQIWLSAWSSRFGIVAACDRVVTRRWRLKRKLAQFDSTHTNSALDGI